ncbi:MAG: preprotein translocase subunit YajC [Victivallaceae bacterium]
MQGYLFLADGQTAADAPAAKTTEGTAPAAPQQQEQPQSGGWMSMIPLLLIFVVFMFIMSRSQKKQQQRRVDALSKLMKGDRVATNAGIYGTIVEVKDESFMVEIAPKVVVEIAKNGVAAAIPPQDKSSDAKCCDAKTQDPKKLDDKSYDSTKADK